jgi:hypothetical protein
MPEFTGRGVMDNVHITAKAVVGWNALGENAPVVSRYLTRQWHVISPLVDDVTAAACL